MKKLHEWALGTVMMLLALVSCQNEEFVSDAPQETVPENSSACILSAKDFRWQEAESRSSLTVGENGYTSFSWTVGDKVGILPNQGAQVFFEIPEPEEGEEVGKTAKFDGGAWALKSESNYAAYYPFVKDFDLDRTEVPVTYTGQKQVGNSNSAHLGAYDYMGARPVQTNGNGGVCFDFDHVGALVFVRFTVPAANTQLKSVSLSAADVKFTTEGTYNLTSEGFPITPTTQADALTVNVEYTTRSANEVVTVYLMAAPVDLSGKTVNISVAYEEDSETKAINYTCQGKNLEAANVYLLEAVAEIPYLTFTVGGNQSLVLKVMGELDTSIEYSADGGDWKNFVMNGTDATTSVSFTNNLRMRGKSASGTMDFTTPTGFMISFADDNTPVTCSGDIRTLVDYTNYETTSTANACFYGLFMNCLALEDASGLKLISNNDEMAAFCYESMFLGCRSLTSAPALPAETLAAFCYDNMFMGCTSLTSAPALPAETLAESCYEYMFSGCSSLISAPALPATTLAKSCYKNMFSDCERLTSAPELLATTLAKLCYSNMFAGCSNLTTAPALPATTLANNCYINMFESCSNLTTAPALPATTLVEYCYYGMFSGCTSLKSVTMLATNISATNCLTDWLNGVVATEGTFTKNASLDQGTEIPGIPSGWTIVSQ